LDESLPLLLRGFLDLSDEKRRLGPFYLIKQLGKGGFAPVWLAREKYGNTELRTAAVKLFYLPDDVAQETAGLPPDAKEGKQRRERIIEEARALCQVEHPNVVKFYSLQIDEQRGIVGLAMEYVAGRSLQKVLHDEGTLSAAKTVTLAIAVTSALREIHAAGLLHRDIKPANIVESSGTYKLIDFGIASAERGTKKRFTLGRKDGAGLPRADLPAEPRGTRAATRVNGNLISPLSIGVERDCSSSSNHQVTGTMGYIDPICVRTGLPANIASDLYSLGVVLFECLVGAVPAKVGSKNLQGLNASILDGRMAAPRLESVAPHLPLSLAALINFLLDAMPECRPYSAAQVARELERIADELSARRRSLPEEKTGPFRGLGRYEASDRDVYFGRVAEILDAIGLLRSRGLITLIGASGSGKSSLARAGIVPAIVNGALDSGIDSWDVAITEPGSNPQLFIGSALASFIPRAQRDAPEALVTRLATRAQMSGRGVVLVIDQAEELATLADASGCEWVFDLLNRLGERVIPGVRTVITVRRDLLDPLLSLNAGAAILIKDVLLVTPLTHQSWSRVLDQSLEVYGYRFEDAALRDDILDELKGSAAAMPLVEFALSELWKQRDTARKLITRDSYLAIGKIGGALGRYADRALDQFASGNAPAREIARAVFLAFTTPQGTQAKKTLEQLVDEVASPMTPVIVEHFERYRLLVRDADETPGIRLAHESLLTQWETLQRWIAEARASRELVEELERDALRWKRDAAAVAFLRGLRLASVEELLHGKSINLSNNARAYVAASRRAVMKTRLLTATAALLLLFVIGAAMLIHIQRITAVKNEALAAKQSAIIARNQAVEAKKEAFEKRRQAETAFQKAKQAAREKQQQSARHKQELDELHRQLARAKNAHELEQIALKSKLRQFEIDKVSKSSRSAHDLDLERLLQPMNDPLEMIKDDL
jgi:serine/threonine protein kinase